MADADAPTTGQEQTQTDPGAASAAPSLLDAGDTLYPSPADHSEAEADGGGEGGTPPPEADAAGADGGEGEDGSEPEADAEPGEGGAGTDVDESQTIDAINGWIEQLASDPDKASLIKVPVKVDGKPAEATISDLVKSYQIGEAADRRLEKAKADAKTLTDDVQQQQQKLQGQFTTVAKLIEAAEKHLDGEAGKIDWNALRRDDPAEYSARKTEFQERRQEVDRLKNEAVESYQTTITEQQQEAQNRLRQIIPEQREALASHPDMRELELQNPEKMKAWRTEIVGYARGIGFTDEDVNQVIDHRVLVLADKARRWDELQTKRKPAAQKKLANVPKVVKPGARAEQQPKPKADRSPEEILYGS